MPKFTRCVTGDMWQFKGGLEVNFYRPCFWNWNFFVSPRQRLVWMGNCKVAANQVLEIELPTMFISIPRPL